MIFFHSGARFRAVPQKKGCKSRKENYRVIIKKGE
jgi:hypothetical protein